MKKSKIPYFYGATERTFDNARTLRKKSTPAEKYMWKILRNRYFNGVKFRRQHPIGPFIADFYCHEARLVIELDGSIHLLENIKEYDKYREQKILDLGLNILRFTNEEVFSETDLVLNKIENFLNSLIIGKIQITIKNRNS